MAPRKTGDPDLDDYERERYNEPLVDLYYDGLADEEGEEPLDYLGDIAPTGHDIQQEDES